MTLTILSLALLFIGVLFWAISWRITGRWWFSKTSLTSATPLPPNLFSLLFADMARIHGVLYILLGVLLFVGSRLFAAFG